ncbi:1-acyl-sn-glycerol-3-phosphate acyltransferase [Flavobacterium arcticum]|uniref:1-acyl-sn-glycerol-3-phosphate acyltransferase n=1 Tax=Flavobacterium arcticum TaxID=1784713 RepID=A0A345HAX2_9FLAO|nr:lysophospholipid acyltransferase family protein [Flavobacterium arcticum]AXG73732.1 1-acyl-sn-glycerol-3-phosphate acyltransferase [Flavobacterium arcticum]KAF2511683.1 1-acyl-sn-glycerol-3-phosphate acyltransferase [Flavobacterium arcticum]
MKAIKYFFWILWRVWFYILMGVPIIVLSPLLILSILSTKTYPQFFFLARIWAKVILLGMGFYYKIDREQEMEKGKSYMLVANHTSMADIMMMLIVSKNPFVFVGKKELATIPIFGFFYKRTSILVDRNSPKSRQEVFVRAQKRLNEGLSICIFPEGGVPDDESVVLDEFKDGAFRLAIEHQIPIVPMAFPDNKRRFSYTFFSGSPGLMRAKVLPFVTTKGLKLEDRKGLKDNVRQTIYSSLLQYLKK